MKTMSLQKYLKKFGCKVACPACKERIKVKVNRGEGGDNVICYTCGSIVKIVNEGVI